MSEYNEMIALAMALGKTFEQAKEDWRNLGSMQPDYSFNRPNAKED